MQLSCIIIQNRMLIEKLKDEGHRITKARRAIVEIFSNFEEPLSVADILDILKKLKINSNKTTIYREIDFLKAKGIIHEIDFGESKKRYELKGEHHHIICESCSRVEDIEDCEVESLEKTIKSKTGFKISRHSLEFFGLCRSCQRKD